MITDWLGVFDQANVDLVLSGHDHIYARTDLLVGGVEATDPDTGSIYFIGGSSGHKLYQVDPGEASMYEFYLATTVSTISMISITSNQILIESIDQTGSIVDTFTVAAKNFVA